MTPETSPPNPASARQRTTLLIVAAAAVLAVALIYFSGPRTTAQRASSSASIGFPGSAFGILAGEGGITPQGAELRQVAANGQGVIAALVNDLSADRYRVVAFTASGLESAVGAGVYWHREQDPERSHARGLTLAEVRAGRVTLGPEDNWSGEIQTFGFVVQGPIGSPVVISEVSFSPGARAE